MRKIAELTGVHLDYWVSRAENTIPASLGFPLVDGMCIRYSENWEDGGPIIEREQIAVDPLTRNGDVVGWQAQVWSGGKRFQYACQRAPTPLLAAMRAYVGSIHGLTVPDEVLA